MMADRLREEDVWLESVTTKEGKETEVLFIFVEKSKTDQERRGHTVVVGPAEDKSICPVTWYKRWLKKRRPESEFLFHQAASAQGLSTSTPCGRVKLLVEAIGLDSDLFGSHSGRSGGATAAAAAGVELRLIKKHGNWRSDAVFAYIRDSVADLLAVSNAIFGRP